MELLRIATYLLILTAPLAWFAWLVLWFALMSRKRQLTSVEEGWEGRFPPDMNASAREAFLYTDEMRADPAIRRLRAWRLALFLWPFLTIGFAAIVFNFILI